MTDFTVKNITRKFIDESGRTQIGIEKVSLTVKPGEFLCVMGPSGCGKSTLLRIMAGLIPASTGLVEGRPSRIGFVFQNFGLLPWLSVKDNIAFGLKMRGASKSSANHQTIKLIHRLGLSGLSDNHPKELSGGQKQRVGLARALAVEPDVLLLDEPFSALDSFTAAELRSDLLKIWKESHKTVVMVTHLPEEAAELADRIIILARPGRVIAEIENTLSRPRDRRSQPFFQLVDRISELIRPTKV